MLTNFLAISDFFTVQVDITRIILTLIMAFAIGLFVFFIYRITFGGVMYSRSLNVSYVMLTLVTSLMLMLINNNLTLSLGMVGALSIIRFRTAVKDPIDTVFMFWAVGEGIAIGVGFYIEAIIAAVVIGVALIVLSVFKAKNALGYLLIIHYTESGAGTVKSLMRQLPQSKIKSKTVTADGIELTLDVRLHNDELGFMEKMMSSEGIIDIMLVNHNGDIVG